MKLGRVIPTAKRIIDLALQSSNMKDKTWSDPKSMKFLLTKEELDSGGFRDAYSMKCIQGEYRSKSFVLKVTFV